MKKPRLSQLVYCKRWGFGKVTLANVIREEWQITFLLGPTVEVNLISLQNQDFQLLEPTDELEMQLRKFTVELSKQ